MNRITRFLALLVLAACGSSQAPPPNMNDACAIAKAGIDTAFVHDNCSRSVRHMLGGLHYQVSPHAAG